MELRNSRFVEEFGHQLGLYMERLNSVAEALKNPESKPHLYINKRFGYCDRCKDITEFESGLYVGTVVCKDCRASYTGSTGKNLPEETRAQLEKLHSKSAQQMFLNQALEQFITRIKLLNPELSTLIEKASALKE